MNSADSAGISMDSVRSGAPAANRAGHARSEARMGAEAPPLDTGVAERLRQALDADFVADRIVIGRAGKIHRRYYARMLDVSEQHMGRAGREVFTTFEAKLGNLNTRHERKLRQMRRWMSKQFRNGSLRIFKGRVDRTQLIDRFGVPAYACRSSPGIASLLAEFDELVASTKYLPKQLLRDYERVVALLESAECPVREKVGLVHRAALAKRAGVTMQRLNTSPFAEAVDKKQRQLTEARLCSPLACLCAGKVFPFTVLAERWPRTFVERLARTFGERFGHLELASLKHPYYELIDTFVWIAGSDLPACRSVTAAVRSGKTIPPEEWEDTIEARRSVLTAQSIAKVTINSNIRSLGLAIQSLAAAGIVPAISPLRGIKHARKHAGRRRSLAEAPTINDGEVDGDRYTKFAQSALQQARQKFKVDIFADEESSAFLQSLAHEISSGPETLPNDPSIAVLLLTKRLLERIHTAAAAIFQRCTAHFESGVALQSLCTVDCETFLETYGAASLYERAAMLREYFPTEPHRRNVSKGNLLALVKHHAGTPFIPRTNDTLGRFATERVRTLGGLREFDDYLTPANGAYACALTMYLCESGANVAVGRTLDVDCVTTGDIPGHKRVTGFKARAAGKPIIVDLPSKGASVRSLEWIAENGAGIRRLAAAGDADRLFFTLLRRTPKLMPAHWYTEWFKEFTANEPSLAGRQFLPSMIRPAVLLRAALENDGRLQAGVAIGQHSEQVSQGYQNKWPTRLIYDQMIRKFQDALEVRVIGEIENGAAKVHIPIVTFDARKQSLHSTGLGTFCVNPTARPGAEGPTCKTLDCWNECPHLVIVASAASIAELQVWQISLRQAQPEWERDRPDRWEAVWLPWLCLTDVVEEKMARGPLLQIWNKATQLRIALESKPDYLAPRPF